MASKDFINTHFSSILTPADSKINKLPRVHPLAADTLNTGGKLHTGDVYVLSPF